MTNPAVGWRDAGVDDKTVVVCAGLPRLNLMTVEARHAFLCVLAHLVFMDNGILEVAMTFRAFAARRHEIRVRLLHHDARPFGVDQISRDNQARADDDGDENSAEVHKSIFSPFF